MGRLRFGKASIWTGLLCLLLAVVFPGAQATEFSAKVTDAALSEELDEAQALHERVIAGRWVLATDPNERIVGSRPLLDKLLGERRFEDLFLLGDEAFEQEASDLLGAGAGARTHASLPPVARRIHDGELGGLDAGSCRSCHFRGGPDGGGSASQLTFFRGNGQRADSATPRDPPHVMGLGYLEIAAQQREQRLLAIAQRARQTAMAGGEPVSAPLMADGVDYGRITALPDGRFDRADVQGVSPDLRIRPFGHKGRYPDLVTLADDGLQQHFGIQSPTRTARLAHDAAAQLGDGPDWDRDQDGFEHEVPAEHALLLASYMAMLPIPEMRLPRSPRLQQAWARGRQVFDDTGCARCHRPTLQLQDLKLRLSDEPELVLDLAELGREPKPRRTDLSPTADGLIRPGIPIYAFTDLKRHDLGEAMADRVGEVLPGPAGWTVSRREWLTRPLWGVADTAPYLHDGRAATLDEAIRWHGGDAAVVTERYVGLPESDHAALLVFLNSLTRHPTLLVE